MEVFIGRAIAVWRVQMAEAQANGEKGDKVAAVLATRTLVDSIASVRSTETVHFFQRIKLPEVTTGPEARHDVDAAEGKKSRPPTR